MVRREISLRILACFESSIAVTDDPLKKSPIRGTSRKSQQGSTSARNLLILMVRKRGFEPLRYCYRQPLKLAAVEIKSLRLEELGDFGVHCEFSICSCLCLNFFK